MKRAKTWTKMIYENKRKADLKKKKLAEKDKLLI